MLGQFQQGDNVLVYYEEDDLQPGAVVGTNADSGNVKLLYTVKVGDKYWVGEEVKLFLPDVNAEDAAKEVEEAMQKLATDAQQRRTQIEDEQRRLEEAAAAAVAEEEEEEETETADEEAT